MTSNGLIDPKEKGSELHYKLDLDNCFIELSNDNLATEYDASQFHECSWCCQSSPSTFREGNYNYVNIANISFYNCFFPRGIPPFSPRDIEPFESEKSLSESIEQSRSFGDFNLHNFPSFMFRGNIYYVGDNAREELLPKVTYCYCAHKYCKSWELSAGVRLYDISKSAHSLAIENVTSQLSACGSPAHIRYNIPEPNESHEFSRKQFNTHQDGEKEDGIHNENHGKGIKGCTYKSQIQNMEKHLITRIVVEDVDLKLESPNGTKKRDIISEVSRARTFQLFQGFDCLRFDPQEYASAGFCLIENNIARCTGCGADHLILRIVSRPSDPAWHHQGCKFIISGIDCLSLLVQATRNLSLSSSQQVCSDTPGRIADDVGDPPGQQTVYIPPGDVRSESYRLSTFEHYPDTTKGRGLAKSGFYFTGFHDQVKCFECGRAVERWEEQDNPSDQRWHKPNCAFIRGRECGNLPIPDMFSRIAADLVSYTHSNISQQRDPNTENIRNVRYPSDLPERIRMSGGMHVTIQSGPGHSGTSNPVQIGNQSLTSNPSEQRPFRLANVVSPDHRRFLSNLYLNRELDRLSSFGRWPVSRPTIPPPTLARSGFFYLGDMDRTQCFSCSGVLRNWTIEDDAFVEHRVHFPNCKMVLGIEDRNVAIPEEEASPDIREQHFPSQYPSNPHMRNKAARLATFDQRWPRGAVGASPDVIAQAGFFFLGERDRVKCWYCNGGLQNWEYDDLPWIEHAKWFPNCQFVLQQKGVRFVYRNLSLYPHLNRPILARQEGATIDPASAVTRAGGISTGHPPRAPTPPPVIIDPRIEMRKKRERIEKIIATSQIARNVIMMGFSEQSVKNVLEEKINLDQETNPNDIFDSTESLLDAVVVYDEENQEMEQEDVPGSSENFSLISEHSQELSFGETVSMKTVDERSNRFQVSGFDSENEEEMINNDIYGTSLNTEGASGGQTGPNMPRDSKLLKETLDKMEEERLCKVCFSNSADMVFIPCGHMICCMECTQALRQCPVCRKRIEKAIKTYAS